MELINSTPPIPKKILIKNKKIIKICVEPVPTIPVLNSNSNFVIEPVIDDETAYIQSFTEKEQKAYLIAKSHLLSSFSLKKSNGFIQFANNQNAHEKR